MFRNSSITASELFSFKSNLEKEEKEGPQKYLIYYVNQIYMYKLICRFTAITNTVFCVINVPMRSQEYIITRSADPHRGSVDGV